MSNLCPAGRLSLFKLLNRFLVILLFKDQNAGVNDCGVPKVFVYDLSQLNICICNVTHN